MLTNKEKKAKSVGMNSEIIKYSKTVSEKEVLNKIAELNRNENISFSFLEKDRPVISFYVTI